MLRKSVGEILEEHATLELEGIDRLYLKGYVPSVQWGGGFIRFLKTQLDCQVPSTASCPKIRMSRKASFPKAFLSPRENYRSVPGSRETRQPDVRSRGHPLNDSCRVLMRLRGSSS